MGTVPVRVAPHRREARKQVRFSLSGAARRLRAPQAWKGQPSAGDTRTLPGRLMQTLTCASNINSKPRRDGSAERGRDFAKCRRCGATPLSGFAAAKARRARSGSSSSPVALAELCVAANAVSVGDMIGLNIFSTNVVALQRIESSVCPTPATSLRGPMVARAGGRHADATGTFIVSTPFLKAGYAELASRLWYLPAGAVGFALLLGLFAG